MYGIMFIIEHIPNNGGNNMNIYTFEISVIVKGSNKETKELYNVTAKDLIGLVMHEMVMNGDIVKSFKLINP